MDISSIISPPTSQQSPAKKSGAAVKSLIDRIISQSQQASASQDVAALTLAAQLQSNTVGLRNASNNLAYISSQTQVATAGIVEVRSAVKTLSSLAEQASKNNISPETRTRLNEQFKEFTAKVDAVVNATTFNGQKLLSGEISGDNALSLKGALAADNNQAEGVALSIGNLSSTNLFQGKTLDLSTPEKAKAALGTINEALGQVTAVRDEAITFQQTVNYIGAALDSVGANQTAAQSLLPEFDLLPTQENGFFSLANLQRDVAERLSQAQGNLLNPTLLKLIS